MEKQKSRKSSTKKPLPKLPYGEGCLSYFPLRGSTIRFEKRVHGQRVVVYGKTVNECFNHMREKEKNIDEDNSQHPSDIKSASLLQNAIYYWLFTYKKRTLKGRSFDTIEGTYNNQILGTKLGQTPVRRVSSEIIQEHINELTDTKSASTAKKTYSLLKQFFDFYNARDINNNPMNLVLLPRKQIRYEDLEHIEDEDELLVLDDDEIERLTEELTKPYKPGVVGYTYGYMLLFVMWSFCRIGEVIALQRKDIDFEKSTVRIYKGYGKEKVRDKKSETKYRWVLTTPKTKNSRRVLYLCDQAVDNLKKHMEMHCPDATPDTFLFFTIHKNPVSDQYLNKILSKALKRAGITKKITVHGLRHTGISYFIRHGAPIEVISKQAGHNNVSTTNGIYYNIIEEQKKDMYKGLS